MAKTNFTKVEEALAEGLRKISVNKLLDSADQAGAAAQPDKAIKSPEKGASTAEGQLLAAVHVELKHLQKLGHDPYTKLDIDRKELKKFLDNPAALSLEDWEGIKKIKAKIEAFRKELEKLPHITDEELVKQEMKKHKTKRFNINEKWVPLR